VVFNHLVAQAFDDELPVSGAVGVVAGIIRHIAGVNVLKAFRFRDLAGARERFDRRWRQVRKFMHGPEAREVERRVFSGMVADPAAERPDVLVLVVPRRDDEIDELDPDAHFFHGEDAVQNRFQRPAGHVLVVLIGHALEVDVRTVDDLAELDQRSLFDVSGRDGKVQQVFFFGQNGGVIRVFVENDRVRVGVGDRSAVVVKGVPDDRFRREVDVLGLFWRTLLDRPILAVFAMEVAARGRDGERRCPGQNVVERFFLDRVDVD